MKYPNIDSLFKFKKIDINLINALRENKIYSPTIYDLNDPFESVIYLKKSDNRTLPYRKIINEINKNIKNDKIDKYSMDKIKTYLYNNKIVNKIGDVDEDLIYEVFQNTANSIGVISFTVDKYSQLMWSHYADSHRGVCIEFERDDRTLLGDIEKCFPILYSSFIKSISINDLRNNGYKDFFRYKSDVWVYEKEWRLLHSESNKLVDIPAKIKTIYFGLKCDPKNIELLQNIFGNTCTYLIAFMPQNLYKIDFRNI